MGRPCGTAAVAAVLALAIGTPAGAADIDRRITDLERRMAQLQDAQAQQGAAALRFVTAPGGVALQLGGYLQIDGRSTFNDSASVDEFHVRRARATIDGRIEAIAAFRVSPDFSNNTLYDAYVDLRPDKAAAIRVGKFKAPVGLEMLQSAAHTLFVERGLTRDLVPDRDIGADVHGDAGAVRYAAGIFDGVQDGGRADGDTNDSKSLAARLFVQPFSGAWAGLGLGAAATWASRGAATLPSFQTALGQSTFFSYRSGAAAAGRHVRLAPQLSYYGGPFGGFAEYISSTQVVSAGGSAVTVTNQAWQTAISWVLTGEDASYNGVTPRRPVTRDNWLAGAVQVGLRYTQLTVDGDAFVGGASSLAASGSARAAREVALGVNWILDRRLKAQVNAARTSFSGGGRPGEWAAVARLQVTI